MRKRIVSNNMRPPSRGVTPEALEKLRKKNVLAQIEKQKSANPVRKIKRNSMGRLIKKPKIAHRVFLDRPPNKYLTSLANDIVRMKFPERGNFNAGLVKMPDGSGYVCVYRPDEYAFVACTLDNDLQVDAKSYVDLGITNCADPRLIWTPDQKLLMIYSSTEEVGIRNECIRGAFIMDLNVSNEFLQAEPFRVSPRNLKERQKNWMPFIHEGVIHLVGSVCPHQIWTLEFNKGEPVCQKKHETTWDHPWMFQEFLRGNTNVIQLDDGNYLGTFHTATWYDKRCFYDNGAYIFEGKPPFQVIKCANRSYLRAEDAVEPHFRKKDLIVCTFPVGLVREEDKLLISYGDNDSVTKIMRTTLDEMLDLMVDIY
jgi:predicted GH43/DUF377 family glycosyl hydrolase